MGYCCTPRCWNTPHAWQMGWITAQQWDGGKLLPGYTLTATLASQSTTSRSGLRIVPTWAAAADPLFVGYRTKAKGDSWLSADVAGKVSIYSAAITGTYDAQLTTWLGSFSGERLASHGQPAATALHLCSFGPAGPRRLMLGASRPAMLPPPFFTVRAGLLEQLRRRMTCAYLPAAPPHDLCRAASCAAA